MKDIDFDELDKAVGSVLNKTDYQTTSPVSTPTPSSPLAADENTDETPVAVTSPVIPQPVVTLPEEVVTTPTSALVVEPTTPSHETPRSIVPPARRRGQFLDMVHPSADMTQQHDTPHPTTMRKKISPLAPSVTPVAEDTSVINPDPTPEAGVEPDEPIATPVTPSPEPAASKWPDPLEMISPTDPEVEPASGTVPQAEVTETTVASMPVSVIPEPSFPAPVEASQTPFVSDAQVEKRPLGAFNDEDEDTETMPTSTASENDSSAPTTFLSAELDSSIVSVESQEEKEEEPAPRPFTTEKVEAHEISPAIATAQASNPMVQSISQQYTTPTAAAPGENDDQFSLFREDYHQPLLPSGQKKGISKLIWILLIFIVLLAVGGAIGYYAYTAGL